jgi:hypothetical protein
VRTSLSESPSRQSTDRRGAKAGARTSNSNLGGNANTLAAWLALIGLLIPAAEVQILIGSAKFTVGRLGVALLTPPALVALRQRGRILLAPDFLAAATAIWIVLAGLNAGDSDSLSSSIAEALEFFGGYLAARAFFFGPVALQTFLRVLKILTLMSVIFGTADRVSGTLLVHNYFASLLHVAPIRDQYRGGFLRATSTFDHAILFGAFCSVVANMMLYSERNVIHRVLWVSLCLYGCILSWSSSGLMSSFLVLAFYSYNRLMKNYSWRWRALCLISILIASIYVLVSNNPMGWIMSHLTLDPESGYWRFMEWDAAASKISESPLAGFGTQLLNQPLLDLSVDSVWLVLALRFGLPAVFLLILTNLAAMLPVRRTACGWPSESYIRELSTGFTIVLVIFMFAGLTVHYWNFIWIFWGICIGIRVSLNEYTIAASTRYDSQVIAHAPRALVRRRMGSVDLRA